MKKIYLAALLGLSLSLLGLGTAFASQITLGQSDPNNFVNFSGNFTDSVALSHTACGSNCIHGFAYEDLAVGYYTLTLSGGPPKLTSPNSGIYPFDMNGSSLILSVVLNNGHSLMGFVDLDNLTDNTHKPRVIGDVTISSSNFPDYAVGATVPMDFIVDLTGHPTVDDVWYGHLDVHGNVISSTHGRISSGELLPTPEPASMLMLGSGLAGIFGYLKRR